MKRHLLPALLLLSAGTLLGQTPQRTFPTSAFTAPSARSILWQLPGAKEPIEWRPSASSFASRGVRTWLAYQDGRIIGSLALSPSGWASGELDLGGRFRISADAERGTLLLSRASVARPSCALGETEQRMPRRQVARAEEAEKKPEFTDGYFRTLRLAVLISNEDYESTEFQRSQERIETWLAGLETYLNGIYVRDAGVAFTIVRDKKLYQTGLERQSVLLDQITGLINERIGSDSYDVGIALLDRGDGHDLAGLARLHGAAIPKMKGNAWVSVRDYHTLAHEIGHLLGGYHTYGRNRNGYHETGGGGDGSEPGSGSSVLGYGQSYDGPFLSLSTLRRMRWTLADADRYHPEESRHRTEGNTPPVIDRAKMRKEYIVPRGTFFTIPVYASDRDGDPLTYTCYQEGGSYADPARFYPVSAQHSPVLEFGRRYGTGGSLLPGSDQIVVGEYSIRVAVSDVLPVEEAIQRKRAPLYDSYLARVKVVDVARPFKMTAGLKSSYQTGEKFTLRWDVDEEFFRDRKGPVRILLSRDRGRTYEELIPATPNDGECEVIMPLEPLGWEWTYGITLDDGSYQGLSAMNKGVLRIETLEDGYYDLSPNKASMGIDSREGIELLESPISFVGLPTERILHLSADQPLPERPEVSATSGGRMIDVSYSEVTEGGVLRRLWSAADAGREAHYAQYIVRDAKVSPQPDPVTPTPDPEEPKVTPTEGVQAGSALRARVEAGQLILTGTTAGAELTLWDLSGHRLGAYRTTADRTQVPAPRSPLFLVRVGSAVLKVQRTR